MANKYEKGSRSYIMSHVKYKDTKPELLVRKAIFSYGLRFRKNDKRYPGCPDVVLPKYKAIIFINGCFWHGHTKCSGSKLPKNNAEYWENKIARNIQRDKNNCELLRGLGWNVIIIWECELKPSLFENRICQLIKQIRD